MHKRGRPQNHQHHQANIKIVLQNNTQFSQGIGMKNALFSFSVLTQSCLDVYACFVDYKKAFDKLQHNKLRTKALTNPTDGSQKIYTFTNQQLLMQKVRFQVKKRYTTRLHTNTIAFQPVFNIITDKALNNENARPSRMKKNFSK